MKKATVIVLFIVCMVAAASSLVPEKAASKIAYETVVLVQEGVKPLLTILALIKGISGGFQSISKMFKQESND